MSLRHRGTCEKCGKDFYWSIGHPDWWMTFQPDEQQQAMAKWWFSMGNVCPWCAPPSPRGDTGISIMVTTGDDVA